MLPLGLLGTRSDQTGQIAKEVELSSVHLQRGLHGGENLLAQRVLVDPLLDGTNGTDQEDSQTKKAMENQTPPILLG